MANQTPACPVPQLFTKAQWSKALENNAIDSLMSHNPVEKLFTPDDAATWLICSVDPENTDLAFGLCDLGVGSPKLGYVALSEISEIGGVLGLPVERDRYVTLDKTLKHYCNLAEVHGQVVT